MRNKLLSSFMLFALISCEGGEKTATVEQDTTTTDEQDINPESELELEPEPELEPETSIEEISAITIGDSTYDFCESAEQDPDDDGWGWTGSASCVVRNSAVDHLSDGSAVPQPVDLSNLSLASKVINENANTVTNNVFQYLTSIYEEKTLAGQQDLTWKDDTDMYQRVINDTGKAPALMGYDYMNYDYSGDAGSGKQQTEEAIAHWERGGLVTFCWHWRDPSNKTNAFYTKDTDFRIPMLNNQLDVNSADFQFIKDDIALIASELQKLQTAGVPVLWRPLHESSGGWFWWGGNRSDNHSAAEAQIALWKYLYTTLTKDYQLNNLIWVWNGQASSWYPGDDVVDIIGEDVYGNAKDYSAKANRFYQAAGYATEDKMVAMTENSDIPDPDKLFDANAPWLYFTTWNDGNSVEGITNNNNFWTGEHYNTNAHKIHVYQHPGVITLDELPAF
ncbi:glycosyl hydrolase [Algibacillus agarilyticus]|uniref:glycosyl hydrolase n=1 Tax=Algibacillus agarilyticus TaxID=2234133 RepID=UPI000DD0C665|nr:glycosyl hydrolase [Algibacillus agarilyticus]